MLDAFIHVEKNTRLIQSKACMNPTKNLSKNSISLMNQKIDLNEILNVQTNLNTKKMFGHEGISNRFIKIMGSKLCLILHTFFSECWENGTYPKSWNQAVVIPIQKNNKPIAELNEFRPIALLPTISKIFEKIICNRLQTICSNEQLVPRNQKGFQRGMNVEDNVLELISNINRSKKNNECFVVAFIDLSKAYDRVNRQKLIEKLATIGIEGNMLKFLRFFLNSRRICVRYKNHTTSWEDQRAGVPQGSCLSPCLFNLYTAPITKRKNLLAFADDIAVYASGKNLTSAIKKLKTDIMNINRICKELDMIINATKSKFMVLNRPALFYKEIELDFGKIVKTNIHKYLGIHFDKNLNFFKHIDNVATKAKKRLFTFKWLAHRINGCSGDKFAKIYTIFIRPIWEFCPSVWHNASDYPKKRLKALQQQTLALALGVPFWTARYQVDIASSVLPVEERIKEMIIRSYVKRLKAKKEGEEDVNKKAESFIKELKLVTMLTFQTIH